MRRVLILPVVLTVLAACNQNSGGPPATGQVTPTVAGGAATGSYAGYAEAKEAFTRRSREGTLQATLEDSAWLRFEGPPEVVEKNHRAYFDYGYTAFSVLLRAKEFTRPTNEQFILEDSNGARVQTQPYTFKGNLITVDDRWQYEFDIAFRHTITKDVKWLKLTRVADGEFVEWTFQ